MAKMKIEPFERYGKEYDAWFDEHRHVYEAELRAIRALLPKTKMKESENGSKSIEIGVGSGRFAAPLGITLGIDPAPGMRLLAKARGIEVIGVLRRHSRLEIHISSSCSWLPPSVSSMMRRRHSGRSIACSSLMAASSLLL